MRTILYIQLFLFSFSSFSQIENQKEFQRILDGNDLTSAFSVVTKMKKNKRYEKIKYTHDIFTRGTQLLNEKKYAQADSCFEYVSEIYRELNKKDTASIFNSAICLKEMKQYNASIIKFNQCILKSFRTLDAYKEIVYIKQSLKQYEDALDVLGIARIQYPNAQILLISEIETLILLQRYKEALPLIDVGIQRNERDANLYAYKGVILLQDSIEMDQIINLFNKAIELDVNNENALYQLGMINYNLFLRSWKEAQETMLHSEKGKHIELYNEFGETAYRFLTRANELNADFLNLRIALFDLKEKLDKK